MSTVVLKNRDFALLWISQIVSLSGSRMFQIALVWWLLNNEKIMEQIGNFGVATILIAGILPSIIFVKPIGNIVEFKNPKAIVAIADLLAVLLTVILFIYASGKDNNAINMFCTLTVSTFLYSLAQAFIDPTLNKSIASLLPAKDLDAGVAFSGSSGSVAGFAGAVAGGVVVETLGIKGAILLNGASYLISLLCDIAINFKWKPQSNVIHAAAAKQESEGQKKLFSLGVLDDFPLIRNLLIVFASVNLFLTPTLMVIPLFAKGILQGNAMTLGALEGALWIGMLFGTFGFGWIKLSSRLLAVIAACILMSALALSAPAWDPNQNVYAGSLFLLGALFGFINVRIVAYFQHNLPDHVKGRFFAILQAFISFTVPVGFFAFGILSGIVSLGSIAMIQALGVFLGALGCFLFIVAKEQRAKTVVGE